MPALVIVDMQWGDGGKGKITDLLSEHADCVVRFHGGANAGHTVEHGSKSFKFHQIPSGILHRGVTAVIANGSVIDPDELLAEMRSLAEKGQRVTRLHISDRAHLVMPYHKQLDALEEAFKGSSAVGTTGRGIGPCYADKASRIGFRAGELLDVPSLREKVELVVRLKSSYASALSGELESSADALMEKLGDWSRELAPYITDTASVIDGFMSKGKNVIFEGAHGLLLDPDHGNYPFVTSSNVVAGDVYVGSGLNSRERIDVIGVLKAYSTRVGAGPFPTELHDEVGEQLALKGMEVGTTTGRRRRCGWLDLFASRYTMAISGVREIALTKLDVLSGLDKVKVATGYVHNGRRLSRYPASAKVLGEVTPVYRSFNGWMEQLDEDVEKMRDLPEEARRYVSFIEEFLGAKVRLISVGRQREKTIFSGKLPLS